MKFNNNYQVAKLLLLFVVADLSILPMLHFGEVPWKPSFVLIAVIALVHVRQRRFVELRQAIPILLFTTLLISSTVIGAMAYWYSAGVAPSTETLRLLTIFALIPLSFVVGFRNKSANHLYVGWIIVAMVALNFALYVMPDHLLPGLGNSFLASP